MTDGVAGTLGAVDHTHPHADESVGDAYRRGPARRPDPVPDEGEDEGARPRLCEVDHSPPDGLRPTEVFETGGRRGATVRDTRGPASD